jgi:hypothetical protein
LNLWLSESEFITRIDDDFSIASPKRGAKLDYFCTLNSRAHHKSDQSAAADKTFLHKMLAALNSPVMAQQ